MRPSVGCGCTCACVHSGLSLHRSCLHDGLQGAQGLPKVEAEGRESDQQLGPSLGAGWPLVRCCPGNEPCHPQLCGGGSEGRAASRRLQGRGAVPCTGRGLGTAEDLRGPRRGSQPPGQVSPATWGPGVLSIWGQMAGAQSGLGSMGSPGTSRPPHLCRPPSQCHGQVCRSPAPPGAEAPRMPSGQPARGPEGHLHCLPG